MPAPTEIPATVTVCITSCGRLDLLARTLEGFRRHNTGGRFLLSEDSCDAAVIAEVTRTYPDFTVLSGETRLGIMGSIDRLYSRVETPFICHLEDDWDFDSPIDWKAGLGLLEARPDIANVSLRAFDEIKPKHRAKSDPLTFAEGDFALMRPEAHPEYYAWSPNPGLITKRLYERYAPFSRVFPDTMSKLMKQDSLTMAYLLPGVARHSGKGRNVVDPTMPARPKSWPAKWARAIKKKLYYAGLRSEPF